MLKPHHNQDPEYYNFGPGSQKRIDNQPALKIAIVNTVIAIACIAGLIANQLFTSELMSVIASAIIWIAVIYMIVRIALIKKRS